jgi:hypothetical protein
LPITPSSILEFFSDVLNTIIEFERDDKLRIIAMTVNQAGDKIKTSKQMQIKY